MRMFNPLTIDGEITSEARRVLGLLVVAGFVLYFGFGIWNTLFNNLAVELLRLDAEHIGLIQSAREIPGFLGFLLGVIVMVVPEMRLIGLCLALLGVGLAFTAGANGLASLMAGTVVMSVGFHFFDSANSSLALTFTRKETAPKVLGALASVGALAAMAGTLVVLALAGPLGYRRLIYLVAGLVLLGALVVSVLGHQSGARQLPRKVIFRRRYWLYYLLTFFLGCRRHIFSTFAILLLVSVYKMPVQQTALLFLANSVATMLTYPRIGHLVMRFGERTVLLTNFSLLALVFVGYAYIAWLPALIVFFVADNILFGFELALRTYFQKIAVGPEEITSNVSMAQTINHLSAVFVPALGGLLWKLYGYQATFLAGTGIVLIGLVLSLWVRAERPAGAPAAAEP